MSGRAATDNVIAGRYAISVGDADMSCPPGWTWQLLTDVAQLESGHTPSRNHPEWWGGAVPWIGIKDARPHHGKTIYETVECTNEDGLANSAARLLPAGTVCLSRTASVGYVVVMGKEMATSQDFVNWVCTEAVYPDFLKFLFIAEKESLLRFSKGTTHSTIYFPEVKAFRICLPPPNEQRRIVAKIEALQARSDAAKQALDAIPPLLEKFRQSVLAAAFRGDLTKAWREAHPDVEPASALLERIRAERRRRWEEAKPGKKYVEPSPPDLSQGSPLLPSTWTVASVAEVSDCLDRMRRPVTRVDRRAGPYPYYGANGQVDSVASYIFDDDLVLVTEDETFYGRTKPIAYRVSGKCWVNNHAHVLRAAAAVPTDYLCQSLMHYHVIPWLSGTTGRAKLTQGALSTLPLAIAPALEMTEVSLKVRDLFACADAVAESTAHHRESQIQLNQSILAKAFRGELVPQDPSDEPATVLLQRIRAERDAAPAKPRSKRTPKPKPPKKK